MLLILYIHFGQFLLLEGLQGFYLGVMGKAFLDGYNGGYPCCIFLINDFIFICILAFP